MQNQKVRILSIGNNDAFNEDSNELRGTTGTFTDDGWMGSDAGYHSGKFIADTEVYFKSGEVSPAGQYFNFCNVELEVIEDGDVRYRLLDENEIMEVGDIIIHGDDGEQWIVDGLAGKTPMQLYNWANDPENGNDMNSLGDSMTYVAVLRKDNTI